MVNIALTFYELGLVRPVVKFCIYMYLCLFQQEYVPVKCLSYTVSKYYMCTLVDSAVGITSKLLTQLYSHLT